MSLPCFLSLNSWALGYLRTVEGWREGAIWGVRTAAGSTCRLSPGCGYLLTLLGLSLLLSSMEDGAPPEA